MPLVSVIIPAYNQGTYLQAAIQSVLDQTLADFEAIIVDDGSTDNTYETVHSFDDQRILYHHQKNQGLSAARNTGIRLSSGIYLSFLDSDDLFLPDKLALLWKKLDENPQLGLTAGQYIPINEAGEIIGEPSENTIPDDPVDLLLNNPLHVGSILLARKWQQRAGYFDETLRSYEDWDMWLRLGKLGCQMGWIPKPVSLYRFHTKQMTRNSEQMTKATFDVLKKFFNDQGLSENWVLARDKAYSYAHLRAFASFSTAKDYQKANQHLLEATRLNPDLLSDNAAPLAQRIRSFTVSPKVQDPLDFLRAIYSHLPDELAVLKKHRGRETGQIALQLAFENYRRGDIKKARLYILQAVWNQPEYLKNRGVVSILFRTILGLARPSRY